MVVMATATGEQHGLIETYPNAVPFDDFKNMEPAHKEEMRKKKKEDAKLVKGKYVNHFYKHQGRLDKAYCRYAGDPIQKYHLIHDKEYTLPLGFIKEVNENVIPVRAGLQSVDGVEVQKSGAPLEKDSYEREHEIFPLSF